jgi:hypothetical protein
MVRRDAASLCLASVIAFDILLIGAAGMWPKPEWPSRSAVVAVPLPPPSSTTIESFGVTALVQQGDFFFLNPVAGGTGPEVTMSGAPIGESQVGGWVAIGAESVSGGYEMAWHLPNTTLYTVWNLDSSCNYISDTIGAVAGNSTTIEGLEPSFHQDLNGDGTIGIVSGAVAGGAQTGTSHDGTEQAPVIGLADPPQHDHG